MMVVRTLLLLALLCAAVNGFVAPHPRGIAVRTASTSRHMFNTDDDKKEAAPLPKTDAAPLQSIDEPLAADESEDLSNVVTDMNTGETREVKWIDPAMSANTNPFDMQW